MTPATRHTATSPHFTGLLQDRLPKVRGRITPNAPLGHMTWFGVGGPAEVLFRPEDREDLAVFVAQCPKDIPITVMGVASNLIIRDGGIPGVVVRLGREFGAISVRDGVVIEAGAAAMDMNVALLSLKHSVAGLEFFSGIPGTIGGALRMNAGAYGSETKDILESAEVLFRTGELRRMTPADMGMSYRHNDLSDDVIFLGAAFRGKPGDAAAIQKRMDDIKQSRSASQPIRSKTGGSTFANPEGKKAWQLIDEAGCRGFSIGGAQMSEMHCNFMLNTGTATAADLERLGEEVIRRVYAQSQIMLRWEIKRIGVPLAKDADILEFMKKGN